MKIIILKAVENSGEEVWVLWRVSLGCGSSRRCVIQRGRMASLLCLLLLCVCVCVCVYSCISECLSDPTGVLLWGNRGTRTKWLSHPFRSDVNSHWVSAAFTQSWHFIDNVSVEGTRWHSENTHLTNPDSSRTDFWSQCEKSFIMQLYTVIQRTQPSSGSI